MFLICRTLCQMLHMYFTRSFPGRYYHLHFEDGRPGDLMMGSRLRVKLAVEIHRK